MENEINGQSGMNPLLRTLMIIHFALGMGVMMFAGVIVVLSFEAVPVPGYDSSFHELLAIIVFAVGMALSFLSFRLFPMLISKNKSIFPDAQANRYRIFQPSHIVRMALLESTALFGLVALLLYVLNAGPLKMTLEVILPAIPVLTFFGLWIYHFPSEQKILDAVGGQ